MEQLPTHVATADEPIPALRDDDGPVDLREIRSVEEMIAELAQASDDVFLYVDRFRDCLEEAGIHACLQIDRDGERSFMVGGSCNAQIRHRSRYIHFLFEDLDRVDGRRGELERQLWRQGICADNRPVVPRAVTIAVRDYLRSDGRILITPEGYLTQGGGVPRPLIDGSAHESAECLRASRAYFDLNLRYRARKQIERAVRMLGKRANNGWLVLEARA